MMSVGLHLFKRTDNRSKSEERMTDDWSFKGGQMFEVPLHDNDKEYRTFTTGLVREQPDSFGEGIFKWMEQWYDPNFPAMPFPNREGLTNNGCSLSMSAKRTYYLETGEYVLETQSSNVIRLCDQFNVKLTCGAGGQTALPSDNDPLGFSVDVNTGAITGTPRRECKGCKMRLQAVDAAGKRTNVADWTFDVEEMEAFQVNPLAQWAPATDGRLASKYHAAETHLLPGPRLSPSELLKDPANGAFEKVVFLLSAARVGDTQGCGAGANKTGTISALTDVATGEGAINIECEGNYTAKLVVRDSAGDEVTLRVRYRATPC